MSTSSNRRASARSRMFVQVECRDGSENMWGFDIGLGGMQCRSRTPRFTPEARKANWVLIDLLARIGEQKGATSAQIALAWLLAQKPWIVPIPGSRKLEHLDDNIGALAVELTADDLQEIESALSEITVQGDRYPQDLKRMSGR